MSADIVFESPADQAGWVQMPNVVLMDEALSMPARLLYGMLLHYARQDGSCFPGQALLGRKLGVSDRMVRDYLVELEGAMLVRRESRGTGRTCRYVLLALGLRAKRLAGSTPPEVDLRRKQSSGGAGSTVPAEVEAGEVEAVAGGGGGARAKLRISGKAVKADTWQRTVGALSEFNVQTSKSLTAVTGTGQPSEAAKRIYSRLSAWPDLDATAIADVIRRTLASRWWGSDPPSVGVVFGPKVFEENLSREGRPPASRNGRGSSNADRVDDNIRRLRDAADAVRPQAQ